MGEKHEITHTQTFFPESLIHHRIEAGLLACVLLFTFPSQNSGQWFVDNNNLISLQLREQLWFLSKFPFNSFLFVKRQKPKFEYKYTCIIKN